MTLNTFRTGVFQQFQKAPQSHICISCCNIDPEHMKYMCMDITPALAALLDISVDEHEFLAVGAITYISSLQA